MTDASERDAAALRDELTRERLAAAGSHLANLEVLDFDPDWWDGQAHAACLVVRGGRRLRRLRIVETCGAAEIVPFSRRTAERWLAERRRPRRPELSVPRQRMPTEVQLDALVDVVRCAGPSCGALLPVGAVGPCPVCGYGAAGESLTG
jgi:hypothetical protein